MSSAASAFCDTVARWPRPSAHSPCRTAGTSRRTRTARRSIHGASCVGVLAGRLRSWRSRRRSTTGAVLPTGAAGPSSTTTRRRAAAAGRQVDWRDVLSRPGAATRRPGSGRPWPLLGGVFAPGSSVLRRDRAALRAYLDRGLRSIGASLQCRLRGRSGRDPAGVRLLVVVDRLAARASRSSGDEPARCRATGRPGTIVLRLTPARLADRGDPARRRLTSTPASRCRSRRELLVDRGVGELEAGLVEPARGGPDAAEHLAGQLAGT